MNLERQNSTGTICLMVTAVIFLVLGRLIFAEFTTWDDPHTVAQNPSLLPPTVQQVYSYWTLFEPADRHSDRVINHQYGLWIPLTYSAWSAIAAVAQVTDPLLGTRELNPYLFHTANLVVHAGSALMVFAILRVLFSGVPALTAAAGALLFALHPIQVEATAWVSGLKDLLAGFLGLAALLAYLLHARETASMWKRRTAWWSCCFLLVLAMTAKPSAVTIPLLAIAIDWLWLRRSIGTALFASIPLMVIAMPLAVIARLAQNDVEVIVTPIWARPLIAMDAVAFYFSKLVWPWPLCLDYGRSPTTVMGSGEVYLTSCITLAVGLSATFLAIAGRRAPLACFAVFVLAPLPMLGLTPFLFQFYSTTADHYVYVAMLGPAIGLTGLLALHRSRALAILTGCLLATIAILSFRQAGFWHDSQSLFAHNLAVNPRSVVAMNNLVGLLPRDDPSVEHLLSRSLELQPLNIAVAVNLRIVQTQLGKPDAALATLKHEVRLKRTLPYLAASQWRSDPCFFAETLLAGGHLDQAIAEADRVRPRDERTSRLLQLAAMLRSDREPATQSVPPGVP